MPLQEVIQLFDLPQILRHNARFDLDKLKWINIEYFKSISLDRFTKMAAEAFEKGGVHLQGFSPEYVNAAMATFKEKVKQISDVLIFGAFYFRDKVVFDNPTPFVPQNKEHLSKLREAFAELPSFDSKSVEAALKAVAAGFGVKAGVLVHPLRMACTGGSIGPSLYHLLEVLGKDRVLQRIDAALFFLH
jgi:glutamyl-tRNA synthetase